MVALILYYSDYAAVFIYGYLKKKNHFIVEAVTLDVVLA
jgi:hypothetical protein